MPETGRIVVLGVCAALVLLLAGWWIYRRRRRPRPLVIDEEAPSMRAARAEARRRIAEFVLLYKQHPHDALVKWPYASSAGKLEYLDARVMGLQGEAVSIRLLSPPLTSGADIERDRVVGLNEIVDWVVTLPDGKRRGGFSIRAKFELAKEQWGGLPDELAEEEKTFADPA